MTQFTDPAHDAGTPLYPSNRTMLAYLKRYAEQFDLLPRIRLRTRVVGLAQLADGGWTLRSLGDDGIEREEIYRYVVGARGRFNKPRMPAIAGLASFTGSCGATHAFHYKNPGRYIGRRVLVVGGGLGGLGIALGPAT